MPWAIQIAAAIDAAHRRGIVHRDLKPANVMIGESGVKLLDFGVAKLLDGSDLVESANAATRSLTGEQKLVGTIHYMSPEQLEGKEVDERTDVFAFGATLYEMLTGRRPFDGASAASVTAAIMTVNPPLVSTAAARGTVTPAAVDHIVRRALSKNPDERWQTARDLMLELRWALDGQESAAAVRPRPQPRRRLVLAAAGLALTGAGVWLGWVASRPSSAPPLTAVAYTVDAPEGTRLHPGNHILAVAPDGRKIAFLAGPPGSPASIWVRHLDSPTARILHGTENAASPFWSPASDAIGFFIADQSIKRIKLIGGAPEKVIDLERAGRFATGHFGAWTDDDWILFPRQDGLHRVKSSGGESTLVSPGDPSRGETGPQNVSLLPGRRFLGVVHRRGRSENEIKIGGWDGPLDVRLPSVHSNAFYAADHLLYRRNESLVAQPFDERTMQLRGQPALLADGVQYNPANLRAVFGASATMLAYKPNKPGRLTWRERTGGSLGTIGEPGRDLNPVMARDGSGRVAVDRYEPATDRYRIVIIDTQGKEITVAPHEKQRWAVFSPDGQWLAYTVISGTGGELRRTRADGSGGDEVLLAMQKADRIIPFDWSPDGQHLIYQYGNVADPDDLWALPLAAPRTPRRLTNTPALEKTARLSPDGRWLAYSSDESGAENIWVQRFPTGEEKRQVTVSGGSGPNWRADQKELLYITVDGNVMAMDVNAGTTFTAGQATEVIKAPPGPAGLVHHYAASPDGKRFLTTEKSQGPDTLTVIVNWLALIR